MKKLHFFNSIFLFFELIGIILIIRAFSNLLKPIILAEWTRPRNYLYFTIYAIVIVVVTYIVRKFRSKWRLKDLGFSFYSGFGKDISFGVMLYAIIFLLNLPFNISALQTHSEMMIGEEYLKGSLLLAFLIVTKNYLTTGFFTGALHEEIFYRGYLQGTFSKLTVPAIGLFISFFPFSFGHYYSHPEWSFLQVLCTITPGLIFCLGYYATGSIIVPIVAHSLGNLIPFYPALLYAKGMITGSYICYTGLGLLAILFLYIKRSSLKYLWLRTMEIFNQSGWLLSITGLVLGICLIFIKPSLFNLLSNLELENIEQSILLIIAGLILVLASIAFGFTLKSIKNVNNSAKS